MFMYKQNGKIDELTVYMVPIADISECGHSYEGSEINFENKVYANVKSNMTLKNSFVFVMDGIVGKLLIYLGGKILLV